MDFVVPKEHGVWAMLLVPFVLGSALYGITWLHLPLFIGIFFFYLSSLSMMMMMRNKLYYGFYKKWLTIYTGIALAMVVIPLYYNPELLLLGGVLLPCLGINLYYARIRQERSLINDFIAIVGLSLSAVASGYITNGGWSSKLLLVWFLCVLFFMGSVFFVKTMIREKNNPAFRTLSWGYHLVVVALIYVILGPMAALAFVPSLLRAIAMVGRNLAPLQIGLIEIANSLIFTVVLVVFL